MTTPYRITTVSALRKEFWEAHPTLPKRKIRDYSGRGLMYPTDTRVAFVDFVDYLHRDGMISDALASRATI